MALEKGQGTSSAKDFYLGNVDSTFEPFPLNFFNWAYVARDDDEIDQIGIFCSASNVN
ncbi:hypothetical protein AXFE_27120 [Acidithrix ferrooxidans]|uniref:Uncharacterized protein n=1 Tax=Acidithrix ferrooxidans TaxID=1280514 RepID=A0A0D8HEP7_9ACTN|nr:hypothetical protein AXFE_27120 [Acidithrix ferrooxidans]